MTPDRETIKTVAADRAEPGWFAQRVWVDKFKTLAIGILTLSLVTIGLAFYTRDTRVKGADTRRIVDQQIAERAQCPKADADPEKCAALLKRLIATADRETLQYVDSELARARRNGKAITNPAPSVAGPVAKTPPKKSAPKKKSPAPKPKPSPTPAPTPAPAPSPPASTATITAPIGPGKSEDAPGQEKKPDHLIEICTNLIKLNCQK